jgi:hypothetical protein
MSAEPETEVFSDRSFGSNPENVSRHVAAAVKVCATAEFALAPNIFRATARQKLTVIKPCPRLILREDEIFSQNCLRLRRQSRRS